MRVTRREFFGLAGALGLGACARGRPQAGLLGRDEGFAFAAINDVHLLDARSTGIVDRAVKSINDRPEVRFTVVLGDLATSGRLAELGLARGCFDRLERPYLVVPGNHDVVGGAPGPLANFEQVFGPSTWTRRDDGWAFIGLDSCEGTRSDVTVQPERVAWLEKTLGRIKPARPIALFVHHPFNPHSKAYRVRNADHVLGLFGNHNLRLVAAGHYHGNQVEEADGVLFTTTACCSSTRGNHDGTAAKGYRVFHLEGDAIESEFVEVPA